MDRAADSCAWSRSGVADAGILLRQRHLNIGSGIMFLASRYTIFGLIVAMAILAGWVVRLGMPGHLGTTEELVRLRNALLIEPSSPADFNWTPRNTPRDFPLESGAIPPAVRELVDRYSQIDNSWNKTLAIVSDLRRNGPDGEAIQSNTVTTLSVIQESGKGYCSDFTQVVNALTYASGLQAREWGMSFDGFGGWGHALSEVFIPEFDQWVFLDVFNGFYVTADDRPLSVLEFRRLLLEDPARIVIHRLDRGRFGFRSDEEAIDYFTRGRNEFYLWWGNDSLSYDQHPLIKAAGKISRSLEQLVATVLGWHPTIRILDLPENRQQQDRMNSLKWQLVGVFWTEVLLFVWLLGALWYRRKQRKSQ